MSYLLPKTPVVFDYPNEIDLITQTDVDALVLTGPFIMLYGIVKTTELVQDGVGPFVPPIVEFAITDDLILSDVNTDVYYILPVPTTGNISILAATDIITFNITLNASGFDSYKCRISIVGYYI